MYGYFPFFFAIVVSVVVSKIMMVVAFSKTCDGGRKLELALGWNGMVTIATIAGLL